MGLIHRLVSPVAVGQKNKIQNFGNVQNFEFFSDLSDTRGASTSSATIRGGGPNSDLARSVNGSGRWPDGLENDLGHRFEVGLETGHYGIAGKGLVQKPAAARYVGAVSGGEFHTGLIVKGWCLIVRLQDHLFLA